MPSAGTCRARRSTRRSPSASCSTTRAACATSSSAPGIDQALLSDRGQRLGRRRVPSRYVGKPYFKPGKGWHYSNTNYLILGVLAERRRRRTARPTSSASGSSARSGCDHTYYQVDRAPGRARRARLPVPRAEACRPIDLSDGTARSRRSPRSSPRPAGPARSPRPPPTSCTGRGRCTAAWRPRRRRSRRWSTTSPGRPSRDPSIPYGLGVQGVRAGRTSRRSVTPDGSWVPGRSSAGCPSERIAIAVLTNQSRTDPAIDRAIAAAARPRAGQRVRDCRAPR